MRVADVVAEILKREGVELIIGYPVNDVLEAAARADIRPVIVRQERVGIHMADAMSRVTSGQRIGVFAMQHGPGTENAFGAVAQAYADSVPVLLLPEGYPRPIMNLPPNFSALLNFREIAKWVEQVVLPSEVPNALRRAWTQLKNGRPRPVVIELPRDLVQEEFNGPVDYRPAPRVRVAPDPVAVDEVAAVLVAARRPVIYAGQGVHYAQAWEELRALAELLEAPVCTSLQGKSAFPRTIRSRSAPVAGPIRRRSHISCVRPTLSLASAAASPRRTTACAFRTRENDRPRHARCGRPQQGRPGESCHSG